MRDGHVTMLGGGLIHPVLFRLGLRVLFGAVQRRIGDYAGNRDGMRDVISKLDGVALNLPSAAFRCSQFVFIGIIAFFKAARESPRFLMCILCSVLCSC